MDDRELKDGGPAFPLPTNASEDGRRGMSLRDYFAAKAMAAMSRDFRNATGISDNIRNIAKLNAELSYLMADAMLKARSSRK